MRFQEMIFSNQVKHRVTRHLVFWGVYYLFNFYSEVHLKNIIDLTNFSFYRGAFLSGIFFLPSSLISVYISIYFFVPNFLLKKKYGLFFLAILLILALSFLFNYSFGVLYFSNILRTFNTALFNSRVVAYIKSIQQGVVIIAIAVSFKLIKYTYLQQLENNRLVKQYVNNEKKLIKTQIQPDFLFYSLDLLEKKISISSDDAANMILNLSDLFSFILYDCNEELVVLSKELNAVETLAAIENIIQNDEQKIKITSKISNNDRLINTQLLLSTLRNLFSEKNNVAAHCRQIEIDIEGEDEDLFFKIIVNGADYIFINSIKEMIIKENTLTKLYKNVEVFNNKAISECTVNITASLFN